MGKITVITCFLALGFSGLAQEIEESILWNPNRKLGWFDFKGNVPPNSVSAATTASGISYWYSANPTHHGVDLDFKVNAHFYPNRSWYKPGLCDDLTLSHEQLHFDIAELFARKMRNKLERTSFSDDVRGEIREIYKDILKELGEFQERYDWETNFSRNRGKQLEWNGKIAKALKNSDG